MPVDLQQILQAALQDRYRIEHLLGRGGMARVYLAHDLKHDRQVAVKVLRPELTVTLGRDRFLREIQIAARLNHPHILTLHDSGDANGLLYYVMPYVEGESVFQLLERVGAVSVDEAVRITREVASALTYAHARGVLHRDIKPGNILLSDGHAVVADFGLARAVTEAKTDRSITGEGLTIGTPSYMSPEQGSGEEDLDARSDVYSLGCVLYELLAGNPPYVASNPHAILAKHANEPVPSIRTMREDVPDWLDHALQRALAKEPGDRFASAADFGAALTPEGDDTVERIRSMRRWRAAALGGASLGLAALAYVALRTGPVGPPPPAIDSARYAVLPFAGAGTEVATALERLAHDALSGWKGITLVDRFQVQEAVSRDEDGKLTAEETRQTAKFLGAGRIMSGELTGEGDSVRLRLVLIDAATRRGTLAERTIRLPQSLEGADSRVKEAVDLLLLPPGASTGATRSDTRGGSPSLPARQAFARGDAALQAWNLEDADSAFTEALRHDADYAQASLWLALARAWSNKPTTQWATITAHALTASSRLPPSDHAMARALSALAAGDYPTACGIWRRLTREEPARFAGWFGLADCLRSDNDVVRDPRAPGGRRFRSSYHQAILAYRRAFELLPSIHSALRSDGFKRVQDLLYVTGSSLRPGFAIPPDSGRFYAWAEWAGDTLVFYPLSESEVIGGATGRIGTRQDAVLQQRRVFYEIASGWAALAPRSADALEALAISLELLGNQSALEVLGRARRAAISKAESLRVATSEAWVRLKYAVPGDHRGLQTLRALADSILTFHASPDAPSPSLIGGLGSLLGKARLAADIAVRAAEEALPAPPQALRHDGPKLITFAALGGPQDSITLLARRVNDAIEALLVPGDRASVRREYLGRAAGLVYPDLVIQSLFTLGDTDDDLLQAHIASAGGHLDEARSHLGRFKQSFERIAPEERLFDALYPAARLLVHLEDPGAAVALLDASLSALSRMSSRALARPANAASLVRTMALRAELAARAGDRETARRWARCVVTLWSNADSFLQPLVRRMARLAA